MAAPATADQSYQAQDTDVRWLTDPNRPAEVNRLADSKKTQNLCQKVTRAADFLDVCSLRRPCSTQSVPLLLLHRVGRTCGGTGVGQDVEGVNSHQRPASVAAASFHA